MPKPHIIQIWETRNHRYKWRRLLGNHHEVAKSRTTFRLGQHAKADAIANVPDGTEYTVEITDG